jgi:hypothetical protein
MCREQELKSAVKFLEHVSTVHTAMAPGRTVTCRPTAMERVGKHVSTEMNS